MKQNRRIFTIPNLLTLMRLLFLIPILYCLARHWQWPAVFWAALGIATDLVDGWIARLLNQTSDLGRILDPVVDKILVIAVTLYLSLSPGYHFPFWFFMWIMIREISIMTGGLAVVRKKKTILESNKSGKWSAFMTGITVLFFIIDGNHVHVYTWSLLGISFMLTLLSTVRYAKVYWRVMHSGSG
jgi:cardiolipin synthase